MALNHFLLVIPQNRFCEEELHDLKGVLNQGPGKCVVLSKSGKEAKGDNKTILQPDGMLVDWNRHLFGKQKYDVAPGQQDTIDKIVQVLAKQHKIKLR